MFYGDTVHEIRALFFDSWRKYQEKQALLPLERDIVEVVLVHPEYHSVLNQPTMQDQSFYPELGETNPFLHMGLHLAVREQIASKRPLGIDISYANLLKKHGDPLVVEHLMMDQLANCLWLAQKNNVPPDEKEYLMAINQLS